MARLRPTVDLRRRLLRVMAPGEEASCLEVPLPDSGGSSGGGSSSSSTFSIRVCSRTAQVQQSSGGPASAGDGHGIGGIGSGSGSDAEVSAWFSRVLGVPCRLVQLAPAAAAAAAAAAALEGTGTGAEAGGSSGEATAGLPLSFANDSHLLVVGAASLADLRSKSAGMQGEAPDTFAARFRCVDGWEWGEAGLWGRGWLGWGRSGRRSSLHWSLRSAVT